MGHIGQIIHIYRKKKKLSRAALADGICSDKYVYLIEKGDRTPSVEILHLFGERLRVDFFEYYPYLDCQDPIEVHELTGKIRQFFRRYDYRSMKQLLPRLEKAPDFARPPWRYEYDVARLSYGFFAQRDYHGVVREGQAILKSMWPQHEKCPAFLVTVVIVSSALLLLGDYEGAKPYVLHAAKYVETETVGGHGVMLVTVLKLNLIKWYYGTDQYEQAIQEGESLWAYHRLTNDFSQSVYTCALLASANYRAGHINRAMHYYTRTLGMLIANGAAPTAAIVISSPAFAAITQDPLANKQLIQDFCNRFDLNLDTFLQNPASCIPQLKLL